MVELKFPAHFPVIHFADPVVSRLVLIIIIIIIIIVIIIVVILHLFKRWCWKFGQFWIISPRVDRLHFVKLWTATNFIETSYKETL